MEQTPTPSKTVNPIVLCLLKQLGSRNAVLRERAEAGIRQFGQEEITELIRIARAEPAKRSRRSILCATLIYFPMIIFFPTWVAIDCHSSIPEPLRWFLFFACLIAYVVFGSYFNGRPRFLDSLRRSLILVNDVRVLGPLIGCEPVGFSNLLEKTRLMWAKSTEAAILGLLPRVQPDDKIEVIEVERGRLHTLLQHSDPNLVLGLLRLLEQIGNSQDLTPVFRLGTGSWSARKNPTVREAAQACQATIEARLAERAIAGTLLRASSPTVTVETLLRPVIATPPTEQTQLLCATHQDDTTER